MQLLTPVLRAWPMQCGDIGPQPGIFERILTLVHSCWRMHASCHVGQLMPVYFQWHAQCSLVRVQAGIWLLLPQQADFHFYFLNCIYLKPRYFILFLCKIITLTVWTVIQVVDNHQGLIAGKENSSLGLVGCRGGAGGHLSTERHGGARYLCLARKRASSYVCVQMSWSPQPARERQEARYRLSSSYLIPALLCPRGFWTDKAGGL